MIDLYLLVVLGAGSPSIQTYSDIQAACQAYDAAQAQAGVVSHIYKESVDYHKNTAVTKEGQCLPVKQFLEVK